MEFERKILLEVKQDYENFIEKHQKIYKDTIAYFRYLEHQGKIKKKLSYIEEQVSIYNGIEMNYKNKLINYKCRDYVKSLAEEGRVYVEEMMYIDEKISKLEKDLIIHQTIEKYKNDIYMFEKRIKEIDKVFEEEFIFVCDKKLITNI